MWVRSLQDILERQDTQGTSNSAVQKSDNEVLPLINGFAITSMHFLFININKQFHFYRETTPPRMQQKMRRRIRAERKPLYHLTKKYHGGQRHRSRAKDMKKMWQTLLPEITKK